MSLTAGVQDQEASPSSWNPPLHCPQLSQGQKQISRKAQRTLPLWGNAITAQLDFFLTHHYEFNIQITLKTEECLSGAISEL